MKISLKVGTRVYGVIVERSNGEYVVEIDGTRHVVDARKVEGDFYTILTAGRSYEVSVTRRARATTCATARHCSA